jgi:hypothetical protein
VGGSANHDRDGRALLSRAERSRPACATASHRRLNRVESPKAAKPKLTRAILHTLSDP